MTDNDLLPLALSLSKGGISSLKNPFMPFGRLRTGFDTPNVTAGNAEQIPLGDRLTTNGGCGVSHINDHSIVRTGHARQHS